MQSFLRGHILHSDKNSKVDNAYKAIKDDILNIRIAPDYPLKISWLQELYGFGTTPIREALSRLERDFLVRLIPNKGYYSTATSLKEFLELYNARKLIKLHLMKESISFGDVEWEAEIIASHYRLSKETSPVTGKCSIDEYDSWVRAHDAFSDALISAHKSPWLFRYNLQLTEHIRRQGRAFLMIMPDTVSQDFSIAALRSSSLRALYAIEFYTEMKESALNRNIERLAVSVEKYADLVAVAYNEIQNNYPR